MRDTHDTFLHFLADNLVGVPVHAMRLDVNRPGAGEVLDTAVNVTFMTMDFSVHIGFMQVSIDVINPDQLVAMGWTQSVYRLLSASFMTPKLDYTVPATPVAVVPATNIFWKAAIKFKPVKSEFYYHYSGLFNLYHHPV